MTNVGQLPAELQTPRWRYWGDREPPKNRADMFSVRTATNATEGSGDTAAATGATATLRIYGPIDSWGGWFGVSAKDVAEALDSLPASVTEVRVRINSPGGEAWEGMAILNLLRAHRARAVAVVDGLAASAASFIAAGCDETIMSPGTQLMIHDASAFAFGPAATMRKASEFLDSVSNSIASIYAEVTSGKLAEWRAAMVEETWYTADEAVDSGLADQVRVVPDVGDTSTAGDDTPAPDAGEVENRFDLSVFNYAGRTHAPAPRFPGRSHDLPAASAGGSVNTHERSSAVAFSDEQLTAMRDKLGLPETADEAAILAAVNAVVDDSLEDRPSSITPPAAPAAPVASTPAAPAASQQPTPGSTIVIDSSAWDEREARIKRLEAADAKRRREERDQVIDQAVRDGKFPVARKDHWVRVWDADPEGTRQLIGGLAKNVVPVDAIGHAGDDDGVDDEFAHLFPPTAKGA